MLTGSYSWLVERPCLKTSRRWSGEEQGSIDRWVRWRQADNTCQIRRAKRTFGQRRKDRRQLSVNPKSQFGDDHFTERPALPRQEQNPSVDIDHHLPCVQYNPMQLFFGLSESTDDGQTERPVCPQPLFPSQMVVKLTGPLITISCPHLHIWLPQSPFP